MSDRCEFVHPSLVRSRSRNPERPRTGKPWSNRGSSLGSGSRDNPLANPVFEKSPDVLVHLTEAQPPVPAAAHQQVANLRPIPTTRVNDLTVHDFGESRRRS